MPLNPTGKEAVYHSAETHGHDVMNPLLEKGKVTGKNFALVLARKHYSLDYDGAKYLVEHDAHPNGVSYAQ